MKTVGEQKYKHRCHNAALWMHL